MASSSSISDGEERKESGVGLLTLEDLKLHHVDINKKVTKFEALLAVTEISSVKWEEKERKKGWTWRRHRELNQKKNVRINTSLKRRNPDYEKDKNWDVVFENGQERRKRYRKGNSKSENGIAKGSMLVTPPDLPQEFKKKIKEMHGTELQLVIQKAITDTDTQDAQSRLSMPKRQILCEFLKEVEREKLEKNEEMKVQIMIDPILKLSDMIFKQWNLGKSNGKTCTSFVFRTHWNDFKKKIGVKKGDIIQVWSFRIEEQLYFILVKVEEEENEQANRR
ncbi:hypothetical protein GH714_001106 [Hevea brasiliensis]|uniref:TF-B3 domain-containing protein n=1 Tax=Hevea brasiliensis TaxID=3981 RepID=A0A6A6KWL8_HEVBR|nr:hypothetical protein GH714_001106 [Hevea brasiliensis]